MQAPNDFDRALIFAAELRHFLVGNAAIAHVEVVKVRKKLDRAAYLVEIGDLSARKVDLLGERIELFARDYHVKVEFDLGEQTRQLKLLVLRHPHVVHRHAREGREP